MTEAVGERIQVGRKGSGAGRRWLALSLLLFLPVALVGWTAYDDRVNQLPPLIPPRPSLLFSTGGRALVTALLDLAQTRPLGTPASEDAGTRLEQGLGAMHAYGLEKRERTLTPYRPALAAVREALHAPPEYAGAGAAGLAGGSAHWAAQLLAQEANVAADHGRPGQALVYCLDAIELGARIGPGQRLTAHHQGLACAREGLREARRVVASLNASEARAALDRLGRLGPGFPSYSEALRDERYWSLAEARQRLTNSDYLAMLQSGKRLTGWELWLAEWKHRLFPRRATYLRLLQYFEAAVQRADLPYPQVLATPAPTPPRGPCFPSLPQDDAREFAEVARELRLLRLELALQEHFRRTGHPLAQTELGSLGLPPEALNDPVDGSPLISRATVR